MRSVSMTELRKDTEEIVERVANGETIAITRWGNVIAYMKPQRDDPLQQIDSLRKLLSSDTNEPLDRPSTEPSRC